MSKELKHHSRRLLRRFYREDVPRIRDQLRSSFREFFEKQLRVGWRHHHVMFAKKNQGRLCDRSQPHQHLIFGKLIHPQARTESQGNCEATAFVPGEDAGRWVACGVPCHRNRGSMLVSRAMAGL